MNGVQRGTRDSTAVMLKAILLLGLLFLPSYLVLATTTISATSSATSTEPEPESHEFDTTFNPIWNPGGGLLEDGASNVLFLPGIMGSHLYEDSDACGSAGGETRRWYSTRECNQMRLRTDFQGNSEYDIYTRPDQDAIVDSTLLGFPLYDTFLSNLADWKSDAVIADYRAIPYDWRLRLGDVIKTSLQDGHITYSVTNSYEDSYLYQSLQELADTSQTGRVTIVAHSNGGLVAKVLLYALQENNDPLAERIDNVILVGVPQVGTPGALVALLHGDSLGPNGLVVSQGVSRQLMNTMPFAHHLLPHDDYFAETGGMVETPVIQFEDGPATAAWRESFGAAVTSKEDMHDFLHKDSGRVDPSDDDLATPDVVDGFLLNYANTVAALLSNWEPPAETQVHQIAGTGLETPVGITYFTDQRCSRRHLLLPFQCIEYEPKLGFRVEHTLAGDETVIDPSAVSMSENEQIKRWWINLFEFNDDNLNRRHRNLMEIDDVNDFVLDSMQANEESYTYLTDDRPQVDVRDRLIFRLHSPLDMKVVNEEGDKLSSSTQSIPHGVYRRYGELQYISVPEEGNSIQLQLKGEASGSFTLEIEERTGENLNERTSFVAIPSSTSTKAELDFADGSNGELRVDYDGNGTIDNHYAAEGHSSIKPLTLSERIAALKDKIRQEEMDRVTSLNRDIEKVQENLQQTVYELKSSLFSEYVD